MAWPVARSWFTISVIRRVFQTSTTFESKLRQVALFMISSASPLRNSPRLAKNNQPTSSWRASPRFNCNLNPMAQFRIGEIAQNENGFYHAAERRQRPGQPV